VDFLDLVTEVIDLRSFSNLWYWIVLAILWSSLSHWTLGVPYHIVTRARRAMNAQATTCAPWPRSTARESLP
jgi:hypothetical protein